MWHFAALLSPTCVRLYFYALSIAHAAEWNRCSSPFCFYWLNCKRFLCALLKKSCAKTIYRNNLIERQSRSLCLSALLNKDMQVCVCVSFVSFAPSAVFIRLLSFVCTERWRLGRWMSSASLSERQSPSRMWRNPKARSALSSTSVTLFSLYLYPHSHFISFSCALKNIYSVPMVINLV